MKVVATVLAGPPLGRIEAAERRSCGLDDIGGQCCYAARAPSICQQLVCATGRSVWDPWRLDPYVLGELYTYMCGSSSGVDVVRSAIDRKATTACRGRICSEKWQPARGCRMSETGPMMLNSVL